MCGPVVVVCAVCAIGSIGACGRALLGAVVAVIKIVGWESRRLWAVWRRRIQWFVLSPGWCVVQFQVRRENVALASIDGCCRLLVDGGVVAVVLCQRWALGVATGVLVRRWRWRRRSRQQGEGWAGVPLTFRALLCPRGEGWFAWCVWPSVPLGRG